MQISPLDLGDRDALGEVTSLIHAAIDAGSPWQHRPTVDQVAGGLRHGHDGESALTFVGREAGRTVAVSSLFASSWDNLDAAWMDLTVHPDARRKGLGSEMLRFVERRAASLGRVKLGAVTWEASPGTLFAERHGYVARSQSILRRQHVDDELVERVRRLHAEAVASAPDYELLRWAERTPDGLLEEVARVAESINDAPLDDLDLEADSFEPQRVRGYEVATEQRNRSLYRVVARHRPSGRLAGLSALVVERETPTVAHQHDTTVAPEHRGHRLGLLMKTDMLLWLAETEPQVRTVDTWNAESNAHMVAVNEILGYEWTARQVVHQKGGG